MIATRHNQRQLTTDAGDHVRNRELWTVNSTHDRGALTVTRHRDGATVTLPVEYVREHVQLGYAATEPGNQADTTTRAITLVTAATTGRGLYVGMTRGRDENLALALTGDHAARAREMPETVLSNDRADTPAVTRRRDLERPPHPLVADYQELLARLPTQTPSPNGPSPREASAGRSTSDPTATEPRLFRRSRPGLGIFR